MPTLAGQPEEKPVTEEPGSTDGTGDFKPEQQDLIAATVEEGLRIQDRLLPEPLYKNTGKGHFDSHTVEEIRDAKLHREEPS